MNSIFLCIIYHNTLVRQNTVGTQPRHLSKGLQCALTVITITALWRLLHLGHRKYAYTLFERIPLWSHRHLYMSNGWFCRVVSCNYCTAPHSWSKRSCVQILLYWGFSRSEGLGFDFHCWSCEEVSANLEFHTASVHPALMGTW